MSSQPDDAEARVRELMSDGSHLHALIYTGEDDRVHYYLAIVENEHEGERYLNERYAALAKPSSREYTDGFRKNGINRRMDTTTGGETQLPKALARTYARIDAMQSYDGDDTPSELMTLDATEVND